MAKYTTCRRCGSEGTWTPAVASVVFYEYQGKKRKTLEVMENFRVCSSCGKAIDIMRALVKQVRIEFPWHAAKIHFKGGKVWDFEKPQPPPKPRSPIWTPGVG
jgi:hypothetical protein